jgi:opacity protein-like surface antigen
MQRARVGKSGYRSTQPESRVASRDFRAFQQFSLFAPGIAMSPRTSAIAALALLAAGPVLAADLSVEKTALRGGMKDVHAAPAGEMPSLYYSAWRGGLGWREDATLSFAGTGVGSSYQQGWFYSSATGVPLDRLGLRGFRGEIETGLARSYIKTLTAGGVTYPSGDASGRVGLGFITANIAYDFDIGSKLKPYIAAGGGYGIANLRDISIASQGGVGVSDRDGGYVYQVGAGASYYIGSGVRMELGYRYLAMPSVDVVAVGGTRVSTKLADHQLVFGLRKGW